MLRKVAVTAMVVTLSLFTAAPALAQGLATVEPTLEDCRAFVAENGVPETRPVWENRGYSGWDVCLNMAYDGDLAGYFASADANGDGRLDLAEQASYMDSVIGPVSDPDQSPLTLDKCLAAISAHGVPAERPFVDWSNRGFGEVEICQSLAFDGDLASSFASADSNGDGRLDRAEQSSYVASLTSNASESTTTNGGSVSVAQDESVVNAQYASAGTSERTTTEPEITTQAPPETEPTVSEAQETTSGQPAETRETPEPKQGVLSAVTDAVKDFLPETGGVSLLGILGSAALITGGFLAYRFLR